MIHLIQIERLLTLEPRCAIGGIFLDGFLEGGVRQISFHGDKGCRAEQLIIEDNKYCHTVGCRNQGPRISQLARTSFEETIQGVILNNNYRLFPESTCSFGLTSCRTITLYSSQALGYATIIAGRLIY